MESRQGHGVFRVGSRYIGVALENISEVCVVQSLSPLMTPNPSVLGAFNLRGALIPIFDLERLSGLASRDGTVGSAAILRFGGRMTGIALDEIVSLSQPELTDVATTCLSTAQTKDAEAVFSRGFWAGSDVVSDLDVAALFSRPDILTIHDTREKAKDDTNRATEKLLVFSSGQARFSIDANCVYATVPRQTIDASEIGGQQEPFLGFISHQEIQVPVVHSNMVLGLGSTSKITEAEVALLNFPNQNLLGVAVENMERLVSLADVKLGPSSLLVAQAGLLEQVFTDRGNEQIHVVNVAALTNQKDMVELSKLTRRKTPTFDGSKVEGLNGKDIVRERERYLIFETDRVLAVPAKHIARILKCPVTIIPSKALHPSVEGLFTFGDRSIPLVSIDGSKPIGEANYILLVGEPEYQIGIAVAQICSLQTSNWRSTLNEQSTKSEQLVEVFDGATSTVLPIANLNKLAADIAGVYSSAS